MSAPYYFYSSDLAATGLDPLPLYIELDNLGNCSFTLRDDTFGTCDVADWQSVSLYFSNG